MFGGANNVIGTVRNTIRGFADFVRALPGSDVQMRKGIVRAGTTTARLPAHEAAQMFPAAVHPRHDGLLAVDYTRIG